MRVLVVAACLALALAGSDPTYDHQTATYHADRKPVATSGQLKVTPFFSPDTALPTLLDVIQNAESTLDIGTPGWDSWIGCSYADKSGNLGCPVEKLRNGETFPIWAAVLNAIHRGVRVRILTNNYESPATTGLVEPLGFLKLAGAEVIQYKTTTFMHAKYVCADGKRTAVSSVNYSHNSMTNNREAGVVVEGSGAGTAIQYWTSVFEADLKAGADWPVGQTYNSSVMSVIQDSSKLPVNTTAPGPMCGHCYSPPVSPVTTSRPMGTTASPDSAFDFITTALNATQKSVSVMLYEITDGELCDTLERLHKAGKEVNILVSRYIYAYADWHTAQSCYQQLYDAGLTIHTTYASDMYQYSHQKFWIVDGTLFMSTGNWAPTDYPEATVFPPYGDSGWHRANRDFTIRTDEPGVVSQFMDVLQKDLANGQDWTPPSDTATRTSVAVA